MIGVVIVTYDCRDVILDCLATLFARTDEADFRVVVVDNRSTDGTADLVRDWALGAAAWSPPGDLPFAVPERARPAFAEVSATDGARDGNSARETPAALELIRSAVNTGFAGGVNQGLRRLAADPRVDAFWLLNPDAVVPRGTVAAFAGSIARDPDFGLLGGRVCFLAEGTPIQSDGGRVDLRFGRTFNIHAGRPADTTPEDPPGEVDYVMGGCLIASRRFYEQAGPMEERYFLFYEEVDWAFRRGALPLRLELGARVYHRAGATTGSVSAKRALASPFSIYFSYRARALFIRAHAARNLPLVQAFALAKGAQLALSGEGRRAAACLRGAFGLGPPREVRTRLSPEALALL